MTTRHSSTSTTSTPTLRSSTSRCRPASRLQTGLTINRIIRDLDKWLNSIHPDLGKKKLPSLKEPWKSGDLREKMVASNARFSSIRNRWQVRGLPSFGGGRVLTTIMGRRDCKSVHSHRRRRSLGDWTPVRPKRQLCSNRSSPCSNRRPSGNVLELSRCTLKSNPLGSIARRRGCVTILIVHTY